MSDNSEIRFKCQLSRNWFLGRPKQVIILKDNEVVGHSVFESDYDKSQIRIKIYESEFIAKFNLIQAVEIEETIHQFKSTISFFKRFSFSSSDNIQIEYKGQIFYCDPHHHEIKDSQFVKLAKMKIDREWGFLNGEITVYQTELKEFLIYMLLYFQLVDFE
jgi:hypothetical protein